jgi:hypothetical protein
LRFLKTRLCLMEWVQPWRVSTSVNAGGGSAVVKSRVREWRPATR